MSKHAILPITVENTAYFISVKGYRWEEMCGDYLVNGNKRIDLMGDHYEYSEVDEHGRRLFAKTITEKE